MSDNPASIILLNGASSAGKSTLAMAIQTKMDAPFLRFSLDLLLFGGNVLPPRRDKTGPFSWAAMRPRLFEGYYECLAALAGAGNDLIVDQIIETSDQRDRLADVLAPFDVFYVGVHCPLPELERRERLRGDRAVGDARRDLAFVHGFGPYDAEVDSSLPADANAESVIAAWRMRRVPGNFSQTASGG